MENQLRDFVKDFVKIFKNQTKKKPPMMFHQMVQLTAMFFTDEEIIDLLNRLLAEEKKLIVKSETEIEDLKITEGGIIKRPKSWLARPAFELASDIVSIKSKNKFRDLFNRCSKKWNYKIFGTGI